MNGYLVLEDGQFWKGDWQGKQVQELAVGEVVFNTSMAGYQEIITDPSYYQQIVVMTAPEQGNYGVELIERESQRVWAEGFVCVNLNKTFRPGRGQLQSELQEFKRPALSQVNTRELTLFLREKGTPWGVLVSEEALISKGGAVDPETLKEFAKIKIQERRSKLDLDWCYSVSVKEVEVYRGQGARGRVALIDYGYKKSILEQLRLQFQEVGVFSSRTSAKEILDWAPNGVVLSNGPGNPGDVQKAPEEIKRLLNQIPVFGICMGHQLLALALGGQTYKLKFGHRGGNHPVQNFETGEIYMTSQNHGYAVSDKLPAGVKMSQVNLYDNTLEGFECQSKKAWGVQYHPEAGPGPHDSRVLFNYFASKVL